MKSILFSLFAIMAVAVFMTSCEQTDVIEYGSENELANLSQKLYSDTDFQSLIKISKEVSDKLVSLKTEGNYHTFTALMNSDNFVNPYHIYIEVIENHERNIRLKYPEISTLNKEDIESIYTLAIGNPINSRFGCILACYNTYLSANQVASILSQSRYNICVANGGDPDICSDEAIEWLIGEFDINLQWYNECREDCPPGPIGTRPIIHIYE